MSQKNQTLHQLPSKGTPIGSTPNFPPQQNSQTSNQQLPSPLPSSINQSNYKPSRFPSLLNKTNLPTSQQTAQKEESSSNLLNNNYPNAFYNSSTATSNIRDEKVGNDAVSNPYVNAANATATPIYSASSVAASSSAQQQQQQNTNGENPLYTLANSSIMHTYPNQQDPTKKDSTETNYDDRFRGLVTDGEKLKIVYGAVKTDHDNLEWTRKAADIALSAVNLDTGNASPTNKIIPQQKESPISQEQVNDGDYSEPSSNLTPKKSSASGNSYKGAFKCHVEGCGKVFSRKMNLNSHIQSTHEHRKPFECAECKKKFARHSDRRRHEEAQHRFKEGMGFICGGLQKNGERWGCGKSFKRKDGLSAHWRSQKAKKRCLKYVITEREAELSQQQDQPVVAE